MGLTVSNSGTTALTVGAAYTNLATVTTAGVYTLQLTFPDDATYNDVYVIRIQTKVLSTEALATVFETAINQRAYPNVIQFPAIPSAHSISISAKQIAGTSDSVKWKLFQAPALTVLSSGTLSGTSANFYTTAGLNVPDRGYSLVLSTADITAGHYMSVYATSMKTAWAQYPTWYGVQPEPVKVLTSDFLKIDNTIGDEDDLTYALEADVAVDVPWTLYIF